MTISEHGSTPAARRGGDRPALPGDTMLEPSLSGLGIDGYQEDPMAGGAMAWLDQHGESLADHPLLRGLLLELPPKGAQPSNEWLNSWFEAARAVLDLIYRRGQ